MKIRAIVWVSLAPVLMLTVGGREARGGVIFAESGGRVVVEAEHFSSRTDHPVNQWLVVPDESGPADLINARGGSYIQALPDVGGFRTGVETPPFVDYRLLIGTPGTYQLYARYDGTGDNGDSFYARVLELSDGPGGSIADWYRYSHTADGDFATIPWQGTAGFERTDAFGGDVPATWEIASPGEYTLRFIMREDGVALDAFVFQLAGLPAPTGVGPPESQIVPEPASAVLLAAGVGGLLLCKWRRKGFVRNRILGLASQGPPPDGP